MLSWKDYDWTVKTNWGVSGHRSSIESEAEIDAVRRSTKYAEQHNNSWTDNGSRTAHGARWWSRGYSLCLTIGKNEPHLYTKWTADILPILLAFPIQTYASDAALVNTLRNGNSAESEYFKIGSHPLYVQPIWISPMFRPTSTKPEVKRQAQLPSVRN